MTLSNCVIEYGGLAGGGGVNLSGSSRILRFTDSISRIGAGSGIKATGIDDKFTGFTRSRIETNAGTAVLLSANASLGNGGGMGDLNGAGNTNVPDQKFYYSSANVIRGNGVNAIQIDATNNDFTKSGVLVGQGDIPIQILGTGGNSSIVGNATAPTGATLTIGPNAIVQLAAGMDLKAGDGTLFGNIDANGYGGYSHSQGADTAISQRISFDKIAGGGNFGALFFSTTSAGSSILNFVNVSNGGTSGSGSAQVIIDAITYSFDFTNSVSNNSSSYGLQFRSTNTVNRSGTTYSGNTTGTENIIAGAVTIDTLAGGTYGSGNLGTQATVVRPIATAIDPGKGIYFIDQVGQPSSTPRMIRFLNTSGATLKIAGLSVPPNTVRNLSAGIYSGGNIDTSAAPADSPMDQVDFFKLSSLALSPNRNVLYLACTDSGVGAVFGLNVSPGTDSQTSPVTIGSGTAKTGNVNRVYLGDTTHLTDNLKGMAVNPNTGNIYIADPGKWEVVSITPGGVWSQFAGKGTKPSPVTWQAFPGSSAATNFALYDPQGVAVSSDGNTVYISDGSWSRVVRIQAGTANLVTQLGNFNAGVFDATTTPSPTGLALLGNSLYISNSGDHTVVSIDNPATVSAQTTPAGNATTINVPPVTVVGGLAGTSCSGSCGDGGVIGSAQFYLNSMYANLVSDGSGLFLADQGFNPGSFPQGGRIRYLNRSGAPATIAGTLIPAGNINTIGGSGLAFPYNGGLANAAIFENNTSGVAIDANNNVWITEANVSSGSALRFINRGNATITMLGQTVAPGAIIKVNRDGTDPVNDESTSPLNAYFYTLQGLTTTAQGVYVVDSLGKAVPSTGTSARKVSRVRFINTSAATVTVASVSVAPGEIKTIAGNSTVSATTGENILATDAKLLGVTDVAVNAAGDIYLSLSGDKKVRKITSGTGLINSLSVGSNSFTGLAFDGSGKLLIAVYDTNQVLRETAAGSGSFSSVPTGSATVTINKPRDIAVDSTGNIYVINGSATVSQIIKIPTAGAATVFAGTGTPGFGGDGELPGSANVRVDFGLSPSNMATFPGQTANMDLTVGIAINPTTGEVIFADANNYRVRRVK